MVDQGSCCTNPVFRAARSRGDREGQGTTSGALRSNACNVRGALSTLMARSADVSIADAREGCRCEPKLVAIRLLPADLRAMADAPAPILRAVAMLLFQIALLASAVPALRVRRIEPAEALRAE